MKFKAIQASKLLVPLVIKDWGLSALHRTSGRDGLVPVASFMLCCSDFELNESGNQQRHFILVLSSSLRMPLWLHLFPLKE
jgi:hypothetical protein